MRLAIVMIVVLSCTSSCLANADAEMYDRTNLWYGSESNFDEIWRGIMNSMSSPSNVVMEVRAFQATNKIPVLAEVIASNREYSFKYSQTGVSEQSSIGYDAAFMDSYTALMASR